MLGAEGQGLEGHGAKHKEPSAQKRTPGNKGPHNQTIFLLPEDKPKPKEQRVQPGAPGFIGPMELMAALGAGFRSGVTKQSTQQSTKTQFLTTRGKYWEQKIWIAIRLLQKRR